MWTSTLQTYIFVRKPTCTHVDPTLSVWQQSHGDLWIVVSTIISAKDEVVYMSATPSIKRQNLLCWMFSRIISSNMQSCKSKLGGLWTIFHNSCIAFSWNLSTLTFEQTDLQCFDKGELTIFPAKYSLSTYNLKSDASFWLFMTVNDDHDNCDYIVYQLF